MKHILSGLVGLAIALSPVKADEHVLHEGLMISEGLICDSVVELVDFISAQEAKSHNRPSGCGFISFPIVVKVIGLGTYEARKKKYLIVKYEFLSLPMPPQYGIGVEREIGEAI